LAVKEEKREEEVHLGIQRMEEEEIQGIGKEEEEILASQRMEEEEEIPGIWKEGEDVILGIQRCEKRNLGLLSSWRRKRCCKSKNLNRRKRNFRLRSFRGFFCEELIVGIMEELNKSEIMEL
jgi:hypothetical protein